MTLEELKNQLPAECRLRFIGADSTGNLAIGSITRSTCARYQDIELVLSDNTPLSEHLNDARETEKLFDKLADKAATLQELTASIRAEKDSETRNHRVDNLLAAIEGLGVYELD